MSNHRSPFAQGIETVCSRCGERARFLTPSHTEEQATNLLNALTGSRSEYDQSSYGPQPLSECCRVLFHGRLLGYHAINLSSTKSDADERRFDVSDIDPPTIRVSMPRTDSREFPRTGEQAPIVLGIIDRSVVEIGPDDVDRLRDSRTDEWSDDDPTPPHGSVPTDHPNIVRRRGKKGII